MSNENFFLVSGKPDWNSPAGIESIGISLCAEAKRHGGAGWAGWTDAGLKIRIPFVEEHRCKKADRQERESQAQIKVAYKEKEAKEMATRREFEHKRSLDKFKFR